jgi:hypothetical protein
MPKVTVERATEIMKLLKNSDQDFNIAISGARGTGKSSLMIQWIKALLGGQYDFYNHHVYAREEFETFLKDKPDNFIIGVDEAVGSMFKREWQDKNQIELMKILNMYRDKGHITFLLIPHFFDLDSALRNSLIIKWWVYVYRLGEALVYKADSNPFTTDVWNLKHNWEMWRKGKIHKSPNYMFNMTWRELDPYEYNQYKRVKAIKRKMALKKETKKDATPDLSTREIIKIIMKKNPNVKGLPLAKVLGLTGTNHIYNILNEESEGDLNTHKNSTLNHHIGKEIPIITP